MRSLEARVGKLEDRTPVELVGDLGTHAGQPWAEFKREIDRKLAALNVERIRREALPLEEQMALLRLDHEAEIAARKQPTPMNTEESMAALSDRMFDFRLAAFEAKIVERDAAGGATAHATCAPE